LPGIQKQAKITSKGQITVPREVRQILGVRAGDKLVFEDDEGGFVCARYAAKVRFRSIAGSAIPALAPAKRASPEGSVKCAGSRRVANDHCDRYKCDPRP
jgi:AbrB family looped-hinge helix DNA binding protein